MIIPSGKGRNGELSIAIILLKSGNTFLASFQEYITEHQSKQQAGTIPQMCWDEHLPPLFFLKECSIVAPEAVPGTNNLPRQGSEHFCQKVGVRGRCLRHIK